MTFNSYIGSKRSGFSPNLCTFIRALGHGIQHHNGYTTVLCSPFLRIVARYWARRPVADHAEAFSLNTVLLQ